MSGKNKLDTLVKPIESEEDFNKYLSDGEKVFVIDVHREWCGPCSVMKTNIDKIYIDTDDCEEKINFGSINYDKYKEIVDEYISEEVSCKPIFLIFKVLIIFIYRMES